MKTQQLASSHQTLKTIKTCTLLLLFFTLTISRKMTYTPIAGFSLAKLDGTIVGSTYEFKPQWVLETKPLPEHPDLACQVRLYYQTDKHFYLVRSSSDGGSKQKKIQAEDLVYYISPKKPLTLFDVVEPASILDSTEESICSLKMNTRDLDEIRNLLFENFELFSGVVGLGSGSTLNQLYMAKVDTDHFSYEWAKKALQNDKGFWKENDDSFVKDVDRQVLKELIRWKVKDRQSKVEEMLSAQVVPELKLIVLNKLLAKYKSDSEVNGESDSSDEVDSLLHEAETSESEQESNSNDSDSDMNVSEQTQSEVLDADKRSAMNQNPDQFEVEEVTYSKSNVSFDSSSKQKKRILEKIDLENSSNKVDFEKDNDSIQSQTQEHIISLNKQKLEFRDIDVSEVKETLDNISTKSVLLKTSKSKVSDKSLHTKAINDMADVIEHKKQQTEEESFSSIKSIHVISKHSNEDRTNKSQVSIMLHKIEKSEDIESESNLSEFLPEIKINETLMETNLSEEIDKKLDLLSIISEDTIDTEDHNFLDVLVEMKLKDLSKLSFEDHALLSSIDQIHDLVDANLQKLKKSFESDDFLDLLELNILDASKRVQKRLTRVFQKQKLDFIPYVMYKYIGPHTEALEEKTLFESYVKLWIIEELFPSIENKIIKQIKQDDNFLISPGDQIIDEFQLKLDTLFDADFGEINMEEDSENDDLSVDVLMETVKNVLNLRFNSSLFVSVVKAYLNFELKRVFDDFEAFLEKSEKNREHGFLVDGQVNNFFFMKLLTYNRYLVNSSFQEMVEAPVFNLPGKTLIV